MFSPPSTGTTAPVIYDAVSYTHLTGVLPPTMGYEEPDPDCDLDYIPNRARKAQADGALSVSLGFGGHNACIALKKTEEIGRAHV